MLDDAKPRGGRGRTQVDLEQEHEVRYGTKELGVTAAMLCSVRAQTNGTSAQGNDDKHQVHYASGRYSRAP